MDSYECDAALYTLELVVTALRAVTAEDDLLRAGRSGRRGPRAVGRVGGDELPAAVRSVRSPAQTHSKLSRLRSALYSIHSSLPAGRRRIEGKPEILKPAEGGMSLAVASILAMVILSLLSA